MSFLNPFGWRPLHTPLALVSLLCVNSAAAGSATWLSTPVSGDWISGSNWTVGGPPNSSAAAATFGTSTQTSVSVSEITTVSSVTFSPSADAFTISTSPTKYLEIGENGIINNSQTAQHFVTSTNPAAGNGAIYLNGNATVGNLISFTSEGGVGNGALGGVVQFGGNSTAGNATLIANGGMDGGYGGSIIFSSSNATASGGIVKIYGNGNLYAFGNVHLGSLEGTGNVFLTSAIVLGGNNLSTTFSGSISGTGGALGKEGTGTLTLSGANDYNFGTYVSEGTLVIDNDGVNTFGTLAKGPVSVSGTQSSGAGFGTLQFVNQASAVSGTILTAYGGFYNGEGGSIVFSDRSTAGGAVLLAYGSHVGGGGKIVFTDQSIGDGATVFLSGNASLDISSHDIDGVNIGSLDGDGRVTLGGNRLNVGSNDTNMIYNGVIADGGPGGGVAGSLAKMGSGKLRLTGANTYTGDTVIQQGELILDGSLDSANVRVRSMGILSGAGTASGNLWNEGIVKAGFSSVHVLGNYAQAPSGVLEIGVAQSGASHLKIRGSAKLGGTLKIMTLGNFSGQTPFEQFTILTASKGVDSTFEEVDQTPSTVLFDVTYLAREVKLTYRASQFGDFFAGFALSANEEAVARAVDKSSGKLRQRGLIDFLLGETLSELPQEFDRIAPEELTASFEIVRANSEVHLQNITDQLAMARAGARGFNSRLSIQASDARQAFDPKDENAVADVFQPSPDNRWGIWTSGTGDFVKVEDGPNAQGYDFQTAGTTVGVDYRVSDQLILGLAAGYSHTDTDLVEDGSLRVEGGRIALFGTWFADGAYLNGVLGGGENSFATDRRNVGGFSDGDTEGSELDALLGGGYDAKAGAFTFGPIASMGYTYSNIKGFGEHGSLASLRISRSDEDSLRTCLGVKASFEKVLGKVKIRPEIDAEWQHEFSGGARSVHARFANDAGDSFIVTGPNYGADSAVLKAAIGADWSSAISTQISYRAEVARADYLQQMVGINLQVRF